MKWPRVLVRRTEVRRGTLKRAPHSVLLLAVAAATCGVICGQTHDFSAHRVSSDNPYASSNDDSKRIMPGESLVMADLTGPGTVTHIWVTVADNEFGWPRLLRLRVYYDGHKTPSVDAPLGDFFGVGHGLERNLNSMMVRDSSFGRARNSYWPMPFRKSCRVTVTNEGSRYVSLYYYHVDYRQEKSLPSDTAYFHAYYRQERPAVPGRPYEFLNIKGTGHYVGSVLSVVQTQVGWFGEGDDLFYVDGASHPQIYGTGTEDYFSDAWGLRVTEGPWAGTTLSEGQEASLHFSAYRWHVPDPIPFRKSLVAAIEHAGWTFNSDGSVRSGFEERPDFFSSVAFWYQQGVNEGLPEPPYGEARLPLGNAQQIAVEDSIAEVKSTRGKAAVQREVDWAKDLLFFEAEGPGSRMDLPIDVPSDGQYELLAQVALATDYGNYAVLLDGKLTNSSVQQWPANNVPPSGTQLLYNYAEEIYVARDRLVGWFPLTKGRHTLSFVCAGKDAHSGGYNIGINDVVLAKVPAQTAAREFTLPLVEPQLQTGILYRGRTLAWYVARLKDAGPAERVMILQAIGGFGADAASAAGALANALTDSDASVRGAAAWALTQIGPGGAQAVPALAKTLSDTSPRVRVLAALSLKAIGSKAGGAVPALIASLQDPVDYVRSTAAQALGAVGPPAEPAVQPLMSRLLTSGESGLVRGSALQALGDLGPIAKRALPDLQDALKTHRVGSSAREVILKIQGRPAPTLYGDH